METQIPQPQIRPNFPTQMPPQGHPQMMMGMRPGMTPMINPFSIVPDQEEKKKQFAKSVYVSGFQKTVTAAMLEKHFSQFRPVQGIKLPTSKFNENKGYAFVYYGSEQDATLSKKQLDRSAILHDKIRVTKTVVAENLSKMIFKLKTTGLNDDQIQAMEKNYFNDENLEKQVERIIVPTFGKNVEVNKIIIPISKDVKKSLTYARVFFYISNLKEAVGIVRRTPEFVEPTEAKNEYEIVLGFIVELLNKQESFRKNASAEIYEYTKKNQSNVLHLKGISYKDGESMTALADELKTFIQNQNMQWQIVNCFAAEVKGKGAWANITFATYDDTKRAYEHLKTARPQFRDQALYGSLRNVKDLRTVVFSVVRNDVNQKVVGKFLEELASNSAIVPTEGETTPIRKYQYFSFNIIEQKSFFMDNEGNQVGKTTTQSDIPESWRFNNTVPRRLVVHFYNDIDETEMKNLLNDIKVKPEHHNIFIVDEKKNPLRANHQKGHIKNNSYVKHTEINRERKRRVQVPRERVQRPRTQNQGQNRGEYRQPRQMNPSQQGGNVPTAPRVDYNMFAKQGGLGGVPKITPGMTQNIKAQYGQPPIGVVPPMGGKVPPMGVTPPPMGAMGMNPPMMGMKPQNNMIPMMGGMPPQMGQPIMGGKPPMMGGVPPMGMSMMVGVPPMGGKPFIPGPQPPKPQ